jgi:formylglycine-generating enzyme required for sulfatase activity
MKNPSPKEVLTVVFAVAIAGLSAWLAHPTARPPVPDLRFVEIRPFTGHPFKFMDTEVTIRQYLAFLDLTGKGDDLWTVEHRAENQSLPATNLTKGDMKRFAIWLTRAAKNAGFIEESEEFRLPTDAEFSELLLVDSKTERGSTPFERYTNSKDGLFVTGTSHVPSPNLGNLKRVGDYPANKNSGEIGIGEAGDNYTGLAPVRSFPDGRLQGAYDVLGNAAEVIEDDFNRPGIVCARGASYLSDKIEALRRSSRSQVNLPQPDVGFRLVLVSKK